MAIELEPFPLPATADFDKLKDFGRVVKGVDPANLTEEQFKEIEKLLYQVQRAQCLLSSNYSSSTVLTLLCSMMHCYSGM